MSKAESIEINAQGVDQAIARMRGVLSAIGGKEATKIIANALNQSMAAGRKEAAKLARRAYTAPIKKLFDNMKVRKARGSNLEGSIEFISRKGVSLIHFKAVPNTPQGRTKIPVSVQILRRGRRYVKQSERGGSLPFIMHKKQGGFGVFVNHGLKEKIYGPGKRKPQIVKARKFNFEMLFGPSPIQALQRKDTKEKVAEVIEETFEPMLQKEVDRILAKLGGGN